MKKIVFFWAGLTAYAARALEVLRRRYANVQIVALKSSFPYEGIEELFKGEITWVVEDDSRSLKELVGEDYGIVFTSGWAIPSFNRFCAEARAVKCPVVCCIDNNYDFNWKLVLKAIRFRLKQRKLYDAYMVPGASGIKLLDFFGVPREKIETGYYAGDDRMFASKTAMSHRENKIICVGQLNARKNVLSVCRAFLEASEDCPGWTLELCGRGPLRDMLPADENIIVNDFLQPEELAKKYQTAKVFILASLEEHWGVVVHEAALAGCAILLSNCVGAMPDFLTVKNGFAFNPREVSGIVRSMKAIMRWTPRQFEDAQEESIRRAACFGGEVFAKNVLRLVKRLGVN